jgi:hypothetical protein
VERGRKRVLGRQAVVDEQHATAEAFRQPRRKLAVRDGRAGDEPPTMNVQDHVLGRAGLILHPQTRNPGDGLGAKPHSFRQLERADVRLPLLSLFLNGDTLRDVIPDDALSDSQTLGAGHELHLAIDA